MFLAARAYPFGVDPAPRPRQLRLGRRRRGRPGAAPREVSPAEARPEADVAVPSPAASGRRAHLYIYFLVRSRREDTVGRWGAAYCGMFPPLRPRSAPLVALIAPGDPLVCGGVLRGFCKTPPIIDCGKKKWPRTPSTIPRPPGLHPFPVPRFHPTGTPGVLCWTSWSGSRQSCGPHTVTTAPPKSLGGEGTTTAFCLWFWFVSRARADQKPLALLRPVAALGRELGPVGLVALI